MFKKISEISENFYKLPHNKHEKEIWNTEFPYS